MLLLPVDWSGTSHLVYFVVWSGTTHLAHLWKRCKDGHRRPAPHVPHAGLGGSQGNPCGLHSRVVVIQQERVRVSELYIELNTLECIDVSVSGKDLGSGEAVLAWLYNARVLVYYS